MELREKLSRISGTLNRPNTINRIATMYVDIPKGQQHGEAWIPCTFEAISYGVDINPTLLKRVKGKKGVYKEIEIETDKPFLRHEDEMLKLGEDEEIEYEEIEKCDHCGQPIIISQVTTTKYRSCPVVAIDLSKPAPEDLKIPVRFGFDSGQVWTIYSFYLGVFAIGVWSIAMSFSPLIPPAAQTIVVGGVSTFNPSNLVLPIAGLLFAGLGFIKGSALAKWIIRTRKEIGWEKYEDDVNEKWEGGTHGKSKA